jgi:predicted phosphoadenosine phosphosulfate sulfurtransferase
MAQIRKRIEEYLEIWAKRGYEDGISDEVPTELMTLQLAPSWKAIAIAILKTDHSMKSLGFTGPASPWYGVLKRIEIEQRNTEPKPQLELF